MTDSVALTKKEAMRLPSWDRFLRMSSVEMASYVKWDVERDVAFNEDLHYITSIKSKVGWCLCLAGKRDLVNLSYVINSSNFQNNRFQAEHLRNKIIHFRDRYPVFSWFS